MGWPSAGRRFSYQRRVIGVLREIEQNHPDLLSFESSDDKRQLTNGWLVGAGLIKG
jgi:hypothetical protein